MTLSVGQGALTHSVREGLSQEDVVQHEWQGAETVITNVKIMKYENKRK